jgi:hypothetical protein
VGLAPHLAELPQLLLPDDGGDRLGDRLGLGGLEDAGVFPGQDQGGGRPGLGHAGGRGSFGGEVADHELAGARAQPGPVSRATAHLAGLDPGLLERGRRRRPGGIGSLGGAPAGVGGVRALVHRRAPQGRVALAVGWVGGVGGGGVDGQVVGVDLDLGAGRDEAGRGTPARALRAVTCCVAPGGV